MYACSPRCPADWISEEDLAATLQSLAGRIQPSPGGAETMSLNHGLHFTGGERFLNFELLCLAVRTAKDLRIPSLFVETNCFWARTDRETRQKLIMLRDCGLIGILISINPFYLEYVPFERSERAIRIAREVFGVNVLVYQLEYYRLFKQLAQPLRQLRELRARILRRVVPGGLPPAGRTARRRDRSGCPARSVLHHR
jgi:hypothetical protein